MILSLGIFALTLMLVLTRPRPLTETTAAILGACLMMVVGVVSPGQAVEVFRDISNILLFFVGLMLIGVVAERAGFFEWSARKAVLLAKGSGRRLLLIVFGLGAIITTFFSNDATALILTPIVYVLVTRLHLKPLPYVFACAFIANTASMILPVSNPVNLLAVDRFGLILGDYLRYLFVPSLLVIAINVVLFAVIFRKEISTSFQPDSEGVIPKSDSFFIFVCCGLGLTAVGYILTSVYGLPLSWPALAGALILITGGIAFRRLKVRSFGSEVSWTILPFIFSLAVLVRGLENTGVTSAIGHALAGVSSTGAFLATVSTSFGTAIGSNLINNWPMMMVSVSSLGAISNPAPVFDRSLIYCTILGADIGPNITIVGSLSSMLWLTLLRQRGLNIHPLQFSKLGLIIAPPILAVGALTIYVCDLLWG